MHKHPGTIIISPRITEKGAYVAEVGCYVFNVAPSATKREVAEAVRTIFKVTPRLVRVAAVPRKARMTRLGRRGASRRGVSAGGKKAYVYLKAGETIELA